MHKIGKYTHRWKTHPATLFLQMFMDLALKITITMNYNEKYELQCKSQPLNMKITNS